MWILDADSNRHEDRMGKPYSQEGVPSTLSLPIRLAVSRVVVPSVNAMKFSCNFQSQCAEL